ncbi:MAG: hypothetical protein A2675_03675 [Candidatus Yonathbacteria bacterium RIFCSPHIGHO2_01_FULL_51_10]|uniref:SMC-Scp complex subunit ScpB n=1 Tax=Candidatus Yonathbacteria bacterium RIFCSPHIGHO2_01_FULL_51_10 TaxID=1802723 RepID=A0A1G2S8V6_9BACT|nr:MAG: hypothetical protein A2675_03675 [Candidatus Yonathbacteria bacterium RIFCSPHIGHO2_01_FULL_51_10]
MELHFQIEAILFYKAEPVTEAKLAEMLGVSGEEVTAALARLEEHLAGSGLALMRTNSAAMLATAQPASALIERLLKEELSREIGKAGIETLAIVLYRGPVARSQIDHIRGVNSAFIVRSLLVRGLIERVEGGVNARVPRYRPTFDLLSHLGVARPEDLPDFTAIRDELVTFEAGTPSEQAASPEVFSADEELEIDDEYGDEGEVGMDDTSSENKDENTHE